MDGIAALQPCYEHLHRITGNTLPFALHEWHMAWCRHFLNCTPRIHDEPRFYVLRDSAGACVARLAGLGVGEGRRQRILAGSFGTRVAVWNFAVVRDEHAGRADQLEDAGLYYVTRA